MTSTQRLNLILRALMEIGVVVALAYWGVHTGDSAVTKVLLGIGAPALGFGVWGTVDFRGARHAELLRQVEELVISGLAAAAWYAAGRHVLGGGLAALSLLYHVLVAASGETLLKGPQPANRASGGAPPAPVSATAFKAGAGDGET